MCTLGLAEDDTKRSLGFGIVRAAEQQLGPADDHRQRIVELMTGTCGELGERLDFFSFGTWSRRDRPAA